MNKLSEKTVIKIFIVLITLFITVHISHAQNQPLCNEGYPNCESCMVGNNCIPWGPIEIKSFPMAALPNLIMACAPQPGCIMKIAIRKRMCNGRIQMKVCGMKMEGCTADGCVCKDYFQRDPMSFLIYAYAPPFMNNSFGLFQNVPFDWVDVDIFSYTCYGIYKEGISCANLYIIPCKEFACCIYSLRVHSADCSTKGFVAGWMDESKKRKFSEGLDSCAICKHKSNHEPVNPCPGSYNEKEAIESALEIPQSMDFFNWNINQGQNACVSVCPDLDTYFKTWYIKDGNIYTTKNSKRPLRFKK